MTCSLIDLSHSILRIFASDQLISGKYQRFTYGLGMTEVILCVMYNALAIMDAIRVREAGYAATMFIPFTFLGLEGGRRVIEGLSRRVICDLHQSGGPPLTKGRILTGALGVAELVTSVACAIFVAQHLQIYSGVNESGKIQVLGAILSPPYLILTCEGAIRITNAVQNKNGVPCIRSKDDYNIIP